MIHLHSFILLITLFGVNHAFPVESDNSVLNPRGPVINCETFSSTGNDPADNLPCTEFDGQGGYPKTIAGSTVDFYHYTTGWDENNTDTLADVANTEKALKKVLPIYENFGVKFDVVVILSKTLADDGNESVKDGTHTPCFIRIADDTDSITETIAHEAYHCVQTANRDSLGSDEFNG